MSGPPSIPKTKRSLVGLDDLIDQSIGQKAKYDEMFSSPVIQASGSPPTPADKPINTKPTGQPLPVTDLEDLRETETARVTFRVSLDEEVIIATKLEAVRSKMSAAEITEKALRNYLNIPPKT